MCKFTALAIWIAVVFEFYAEKSIPFCHIQRLPLHSSQYTLTALTNDDSDPSKVRNTPKRRIHILARLTNAPHHGEVRPRLREAVPRLHPRPVPSRMRDLPGRRKRADPLKVKVGRHNLAPARRDLDRAGEAHWGAGLDVGARFAALDAQIDDRLGAAALGGGRGSDDLAVCDGVVGASRRGDAVLDPLGQVAEGLLDDGRVGDDAGYFGRTRGSLADGSCGDVCIAFSTM